MSQLPRKKMDKKKLAMIGGGLAIAGAVGLYLKDKLGIGEGLESYATGGGDWAVSGGGGGYLPSIPEYPDTPIPIDPAKPFPDYDPSGGYGGNTIGFNPSFGGNDLPINPPPEKEDQGKMQYTIVNQTIPEGFLGGWTSEVAKPSSTKPPTIIDAVDTKNPFAWQFPFVGLTLGAWLAKKIMGVDINIIPSAEGQTSNVPPTQSGSPKIPYPQRPIGSTFGTLPHYMRTGKTDATSQPIGIASPFAGFGWGTKTPSTPTFTNKVVQTMKSRQVTTSLDKPSWLG